MNIKLLATVEATADSYAWVVQCLDHDLAAQGRTLGKALKRFIKTFQGHHRLALQHGQNPFARKPAPKFYGTKWARGFELGETTLFTVIDTARRTTMINCRVRVY